MKCCLGRKPGPAEDSYLDVNGHEGLGPLTAAVVALTRAAPFGGDPGSRSRNYTPETKDRLPCLNRNTL